MSDHHVPMLLYSEVQASQLKQLWDSLQIMVMTNTEAISHEVHSNITLGSETVRMVSKPLPSPPIYNLSDTVSTASVAAKRVPVNAPLFNEFEAAVCLKILQSELNEALTSGIPRPASIADKTFVAQLELTRVNYQTTQVLAVITTIIDALYRQVPMGTDLFGIFEHLDHKVRSLEEKEYAELEKAIVRSASEKSDESIPLEALALLRKLISQSFNLLVEKNTETKLERLPSPDLDESPSPIEFLSSDTSTSSSTGEGQISVFSHEFDFDNTTVLTDVSSETTKYNQIDITSELTLPADINDGAETLESSEIKGSSKKKRFSLFKLMGSSSSKPNLPRKKYDFPKPQSNPSSIHSQYYFRTEPLVASFSRSSKSVR